MQMNYSFALRQNKPNQSQYIESSSQKFTSAKAYPKTPEFELNCKPKLQTLLRWPIHMEFDFENYRLYINARLW